MNIQGNINKIPKASEIINKLQELINIYGNIPIEITYDSGWGEFFLTVSDEDWFYDEENNCIAFFG